VLVPNEGYVKGVRHKILVVGNWLFAIVIDNLWLNFLLIAHKPQSIVLTVTPFQKPEQAAKVTRLPVLDVAEYLRE
jgi:hypothetical protein